MKDENNIVNGLNAENTNIEKNESKDHKNIDDNEQITESESNSNSDNIDTAQNEKNNNKKAEADTKNKVVSTGSFLGWSILFDIPLIGIVACVIMCFASKRLNMKNYARARFAKAAISTFVSTLISAIIFVNIGLFIGKTFKSFKEIEENYLEIIDTVKNLELEDFENIYKLVKDYQNNKDKVLDKTKENISGVKEKIEGLEDLKEDKKEELKDNVNDKVEASKNKIDTSKENFQENHHIIDGLIQNN